MFNLGFKKYLIKHFFKQFCLKIHISIDNTVYKLFKNGQI